MSSLLIKNIGRLQTPIGSHSHFGDEQGKNLKLDNAAILVDDDKIVKIYSKSEQAKDVTADRVIDAGGRLVTPGLVDGHTHLVFGGFREKEIPLKLKGAGYLEIHEAGGGINSTVQSTRKATFDELYCKTEKFLDEIIRNGVTTIEAKSGYGLDLDSELKMLEVVKKLNEDSKIDIVSTFMGAHATPAEFKGREDDFINEICENWLPVVAKKNLAEFCDVFCEKGVFNVEQSRRYLEKAKKLGFDIKIHADEIFDIGGSTLAGDIGATSAEHLISIGDDGLKSMARSKTIAVLLPGTSFYLGANFAPAREMINLGIPVAIATDFNPGSCPSLNLQFIINLGYLKYRMYPEEILTAVTINPACAIGRGKEIGTLEEGKKADIIVWDAPNFERICYRYGSNLVKTVIKGGEVLE